VKGKVSFRAGRKSESLSRSGKEGGMVQTGASFNNTHTPKTKQPDPPTATKRWMKRGKRQLGPSILSFSPPELKQKLRDRKKKARRIQKKKLHQCIIKCVTKLSGIRPIRNRPSSDQHTPTMGQSKPINIKKVGVKRGERIPEKKRQQQGSRSRKGPSSGNGSISP